MEFLGKTTIDFVGKRNISFVISAVISIIGIIAIVQMSRGAANMGIDFTGGTSVQLKFDKPFALADARKALHAAGIEAELQEVKEGNKLLVKLPRKNALAVGKAAELVPAAFVKAQPGLQVTVDSTTEIGPSIGEKLRKDTIIAVAISMLGIICYIAWRFDFKFGVGAVVATLHDVLAMFAAYYVTGREFNLLFITAVLTIAGYSLTDTVVIFDRIRENLHKDLKGSLHKIFNNSINETLSRSIITSLTTFLAAISLFVWGGEVIHDFSFALLVGIGVATYSSVFVASPVVLLLEQRAMNKQDAGTGQPVKA
ncbi:protein translocase subunit SecF [Trichlorobacter lovleyi]|uniref:protein translocase subunit SecF n=1 Tax=Trichlorobacter lovleyi TaxID=313985 RepID=UPI0022407580|nr:protein translocase subunit SecF [Trichlorobacter lovleyi]QOX80689.1 protein translocase subunit SecF [Trichlorobacter lovleyi]